WVLPLRRGRRGRAVWRRRTPGPLAARLAGSGSGDREQGPRRGAGIRRPGGTRPARSRAARDIRPGRFATLRARHPLWAPGGGTLDGLARAWAAGRLRYGPHGEARRPALAH